MKDMLMKKSPLNNRERAAHCENNEQSLEPPPAKKKVGWLGYWDLQLKRQMAE